MPLGVGDKLASLSAQALQSTKRAVNVHIRRDANAVLDYALAAEFQSYDTPKHHEFVRMLQAK
jgi:enoyl-CoA hydratase